MQNEIKVNLINFLSHHRCLICKGCAINERLIIKLANLKGILYYVAFVHHFALLSR